MAARAPSIPIHRSEPISKRGTAFLRRIFGRTPVDPDASAPRVEREPITVRRMAFDLPPHIPSVFVEGEPEESYGYIALSLVLPYLEPYLVRTMKSAKSHVHDATLAREVVLFSAQESHHSNAHARFNELFRGPSQEVVALERALDADYRRFTTDRSLRFNLAYAEGFEALTSAIARVLLDLDRSTWHPDVRALFEWHLVEELEHRTVAFDVYGHVVGSYAYKVVVGIFAQAHLLRFVVRAAAAMLRADPNAAASFGGSAGRRRRLLRLLRLVVGELLPRVLRSYSPWYRPHDLPMPESYYALRLKYTRMAKSRAA